MTLLSSVFGPRAGLVVGEPRPGRPRTHHPERVNGDSSRPGDAWRRPPPEARGMRFAALVVAALVLLGAGVAISGCGGGSQAAGSLTASVTRQERTSSIATATFAPATGTTTAAAEEAEAIATA